MILRLAPRPFVKGFWVGPLCCIYGLRVSIKRMLGDFRGNLWVALGLQFGGQRLGGATLCCRLRFDMNPKPRT